MAAIVASVENFNFLKKALRLKAPNIGSSHLSEGLAAGFGFLTHAALLAAIGNDTHPLLLRLDGSRMTKRLAQLGHLGFDSGDVINAMRSAKLPHRIWAEFRDGDMGANDVWYRECCRRNIPMLYIKTRRKFVELNWDCITIRNENEAHVQGDAGDRLVHEMFSRFQSMTHGVSGKPFFDGKSFVGWVDRLSPDMARDMADEFFCMLFVPMCQTATAA